MIYLYSGTPGSGKSLHTARVIKNTLMMGKPVIANIPINVNLCKHPERFLFSSLVSRVLSSLSWSNMVLSSCVVSLSKIKALTS